MEGITCSKGLRACGRIAQPILYRSTGPRTTKPIVPFRDRCLCPDKERGCEGIIGVTVVPRHARYLHFPKKLCRPRKPIFDQWRQLPPETEQGEPRLPAEFPCK